MRTLFDKVNKVTQQRDGYRVVDHSTLVEKETEGLLAIELTHKGKLYYGFIYYSEGELGESLLARGDLKKQYADVDNATYSGVIVVEHVYSRMSDAQVDKILSEFDARMLEVVNPTQLLCCKADLLVEPSRKIDAPQHYTFVMTIAPVSDVAKNDGRALSGELHINRTQTYINIDNIYGETNVPSALLATLVKRLAQHFRIRGVCIKHGWNMELYFSVSQLLEFAERNQTFESTDSHFIAIRRHSAYFVVHEHDMVTEDTTTTAK